MTHDARPEPRQLLDTLLASSSPIGFTFRCMEIAEEAIHEAKQQSPLLSAELDAAFRSLCPTEPLRGLDEAVYRHHCHELLDRVVGAQDLSLGTAAECLGLLSRASLEAPPSRAAQLLYWDLFEQVLPEEAQRLCGTPGFSAPDDHDRACMKELESDLRCQLASTRDVD